MTGSDTLQAEARPLSTRQTVIELALRRAERLPLFGVWSATGSCGGARVRFAPGRSGWTLSVLVEPFEEPGPQEKYTFSAPTASACAAAARAALVTPQEA